METYKEEIKAFEGACCPLPARVHCPYCNDYSWLFKLGVLFHAAMILGITITLILLCLAVNRDSMNLTEHIKITTADHDKERDLIQSAMKTTLENRAFQAEIKGILSAWIEERRRYEQQKKR